MALIEAGSELFAMELEVGAGVFADGAEFRRFGAADDVAAVPANPVFLLFLHKDLAGFNIGQEGLVALFVAFFNLGDLGEEGGNFGEAFFFGDIGEALVHLGPLVVLAGGGFFEVLGGVANAVEQLEPDFRVFLFVASGFFEDGGDLLVAFFAGGAGEVGVFVAGLGFASECFLEVLFGSATFELGHGNLSLTVVGWVLGGKHAAQVRCCFISVIVLIMMVLSRVASSEAICRAQRVLEYGGSDK